MKKKKMLKTGLAVFLAGVVLCLSPTASAYVMSKSTVYTDAVSDVIYTGVSTISDSRIVVSMEHPSLGKALRIFDVNSTSASQVGGTLVTNTSDLLYDVAYVGNNGNEEMFYVVRDNGSSVFEYWWDPNTYAGSYQGIVNKYDNGTRFPGMDRQLDMGKDDLIQCSITRVYDVNGNENPAVRTNIYGPIGNGAFEGISSLGDINGDEQYDYAVVRNNDAGQGWLHIMTSTISGYTIPANYLEDSSHNYYGVAYLGDPDDDSFREFVIVSVDAAFGTGGYIEYVETDIPLEAGPVCGDAEHPYPVGDVTLNCVVDFEDIAAVASNWLFDNRP